MLKARVFFVRHGESEANVRPVIANRTSDVAPLTDLGRQQAEELRDKLHDLGTITAIYTSPLQRARETAEIVASCFAIEITIDAALGEPYCGEIEGRGDSEAWRLHAEQEHEWRIGNHDHRIPGGESLREVEKRFMPFVHGVLSGQSHAGGDILIVSHGSVLTHMLPRILANVDHAFVRSHPLRNCAVVVSARTASGLECLEWDGIRMGGGKS